MISPLLVRRARTPVLALSGFASQSYVDHVAADVAADARPAVLLYAGDFDPSGEDIERDFLVRAECFAETVRVALDWDQIEEFDLPSQEGKASDSRARASLPATAGSYGWS